MLRTSLGIECGYDDSAYAYERQRRGWRRIWESEQVIASGTPYRPQRIDAVNTSFARNEQPHRRLVLTLGQGNWCWSNWRSVTYRLWRTGEAEADAKLLIDENAIAYLGAHEQAIVGSVDEGDVLIVYRTGSLDVEFHSYDTVRH